MRQRAIELRLKAGPILVLHDTTEFTYKRDDIEAIGKTLLGVAGVDLDGRPRHYTACGILRAFEFGADNGWTAAGTHSD